jgi:hypothetical protein
MLLVFLVHRLGLRFCIILALIVPQYFEHRGLL